MTTNWKCQCGVVNFATDPVCKKCQAEKPQLDDDSSRQPAAAATVVPGSFPKAYGPMLIGLVCLCVLLLGWSVFKPRPKFEYAIVQLGSESNERTGAAAMKFATIKVEESRLTSMGDEGWELVSSWLEMETAYPNFGKEEYVTGLQPNIRPQRAVLLFKRQR
ncbi:MAG: hypothetical protein V7641_2895 [Blastocatellia bacterium]